MRRNNPFRLFNLLFAISITILLSTTTAYAEKKEFNLPCFSISLATNLQLISKTEEKEQGFYRYVFATSNNDDADLQIRVIVSNKQPEDSQSLEDFQTASIGAMSAMFMDSYKLYEYIKTPENQKVLNEKPKQLNLNNVSFASVTMYFGNMDTSFLVTRAHNMTYAFTLVSKNNNEQIRKNNLKMLTEQLQTIKFQSCSE